MLDQILTVTFFISSFAIVIELWRPRSFHL